MRAEPAGLVSAPTAPELAGLLYRLLDTRQPAQPPRTGQARDGGAHQWPASQPASQPASLLMPDGTQPGGCLRAARAPAFAAAGVGGLRVPST